MSKHTPGPWLRFDSGGEMMNGHHYGQQFADCVWRPEGPGHGLICDCSPYGQQATPETIANARLIVTAPDLLAFAEKVFATRRFCTTELELLDGWRAMQDEASVLISKATGES